MMMVKGENEEDNSLSLVSLGRKKMGFLSGGKKRRVYMIQLGKVLSVCFIIYSKEKARMGEGRSRHVGVLCSC